MELRICTPAFCSPKMLRCDYRLCEQISGLPLGKSETHRQPFKLWQELHIFNMAQRKVCLYFYLFSSKAIRYYPKVLIYYVNLGSILEYRALYSRCNGCIFKDLIIIRVRTEDWFSMFQTYQNNLPLQYYYITIQSLGPKQKQTRCSFVDNSSTFQSGKNKDQRTELLDFPWKREINFCFYEHYKIGPGSTECNTVTGSVIY